MEDCTYIKLVPIGDFSSQQSILLKGTQGSEIASVILGRNHEAFSSTLQSDKRCSINQLRLDIDSSEHRVELTLQGVNHIIVKRVDGTKIVLDANNFVCDLYEGDTFCMIVDEFPLKVESIHFLSKKRKDITDDQRETVVIKKSKLEKPLTNEKEQKEGKLEDIEPSTESDSNRFSIKEVYKNLFESKDSLVHCVSQDLQMDKGIAATFKKMFGGEDQLKKQQVAPGGVAYLEDSKANRHIYYLVTKVKYWQKPTYEKLRESLEKLKELCIKHNTTKLSMPKIGCGLDKLEWSKVKEMLTEVFIDMNMKITVYSYKEDKSTLNTVSQSSTTTSKSSLSIKVSDIPLSAFTWQTVSSTLYSFDAPKLGSDRIIAFDMDGTLITTKMGKKFPIDRNDWKWLYPQVPKLLKEKHKEGYKIVIFTNQAGVSKGKQKLSDLKGKIGDMCTDLGFGIQTFIATSNDIYRKPSTSMWDEMINKKNNGIHPDISNCLYVGDAAGRTAGWKPSAPRDFSCSDRGFAFNIGIKFKTPEEFFLNEQPTSKFVWDGVDPEKILENATTKYKAKDLIKSHQELVVFVGFPASGKSTITKRYFEPNGYVRVNMDTLKTKDKCIKLAKESLDQGKSVVIDNTNPSKEVRLEYIKLAKQRGIPCRCYYINTTLEVAQHLNCFREKITKGEISKIPDIAYNVYRSRLKEPSINEGFDEVKTLSFVPEFDNPHDKKIFLQRT